MILYVAVWGALVWPIATLQADHLDFSSPFNLDSPHAPGHLLPHPLPPAVPTGCRGPTHSSYCGFGGSHWDNLLFPLTRGFESPELESRRTYQMLK